VSDLIYKDTYGFDFAYLLPSGKRFSIGQSEKERNRKWFLSGIDPITKKFWTTSVGADNDMYLYDIDIIDGTIKQEIYLQFEKKINSFDIFNNKVAFTYSSKGEYVIIDLLTNEREEVKIDKVPMMREVTWGEFRIIEIFPPGYDDTPKAYDGKSLIFNNGYYNTANKHYYFFKTELNFPRCQPEGIRIGLDEKGFIVYHNIYNDTIVNTGIKRRTSDFFHYYGWDLYYLDINGRYLYYSKDIYDIKSIVRQMFSFLTLPWCSLKWYRINLDTRKKERIKVASKEVTIYGVVSIQE
jgi:hypothetical protein